MLVGSLCRRALAVALCLVGALASTVRAQCPEAWLPGQLAGGPVGVANSVVSWDPDGAGPQQPWLVFGFANQMAGITSAGTSGGVAAWDGVSMRSLGTAAPNGSVDALIVYNGNL